MLIDETSDSGSTDDGDNYFVSMTDMMIGVLFIFIIMLMVFALEFRKKTDVREDAIGVARQVARKLDDLRKEVDGEIASLDEAQKTRRQLLLDIETQLRAQGLNVQVDETNGVLRLTEDAVRFASNQSELVGHARENVAKIAQVLQLVLPKYANCWSDGQQVKCTGTAVSTVETVFIEGHTDVTGPLDPVERDHRNWQLSTERAVNTYREIMSQAPGLRSSRNLRQEEIISVSGYSSTRPIDPNEGRDAWSKNRRIDLRFVMEVDSKQRLQEIRNLTDQMKDQIDRLTKASGG